MPSWKSAFCFKKWLRSLSSDFRCNTVQPTLLKSIRFCFIDVRWLLTAFDFQILKTTTCTLSYKTLKILSTFCSLVWKIRENLKILFSKIWPDRTDSCNIMCIWVKSPGEFKNLDLSKVNEHRTSSSLLESLKLSCSIIQVSMTLFEISLKSKVVLYFGMINAIQMFSSKFPKS